MAARIRPGPFGLPMLIPDERMSLSFSGSSRQRVGSAQTTVLQKFLFSLWAKPTTSGTLRALISKNMVNANAVTDFPCALTLNTSNQAVLSLSKGDDFVADLTLTSDTLVTANTWHYIAAAYDGSTAYMFTDGAYKSSAGAMTLSSNTASYTIGNSAVDHSSGAGADTQLYIGQMFDPRVYNWDGNDFVGSAIRLMRGEDVRAGLVCEWMPRGIVPRRARSGLVGS